MYKHMHVSVQILSYQPTKISPGLTDCCQYSCIKLTIVYLIFKKCLDYLMAQHLSSVAQSMKPSIYLILKLSLSLVSVRTFHIFVTVQWRN